MQTNTKFIRVQHATKQIDHLLPARIQISLFNRFCQLDYLGAIASWCTDNIGRIIEFQVADTLQRHNLAWQRELSPELARTRAREKGDVWIDRNMVYVREASRNANWVSITRWDGWIQHPEFGYWFDHFSTLSREDEGFMQALRTEVSDYFTRTLRSPKNYREQISLKFLIEEIAVSELSARHFPANEIYPGPRLRPEIYLAESTRHSDHYHLARIPYISLDLRDLRRQLESPEDELSPWRSGDA